MSLLSARSAGGLLLAASLAVRAAGPPPFSPQRYDEDWRAACAQDAGAAPAFKCLSPLGRGSLLSLGGEWRERYESTDPGNFGIGEGHDAVLLHRLLGHADLRRGQRLRLFAQLGLHRESGRAGGPSPTDENDADLQQGFADLALSAAGGNLLLRAGRQEFVLGSSRLVSVRESPNIRRSFDGLRGSWRSGALQADAFYLKPLHIEPAGFDDRASPSERLWGAQLGGGSLSSGPGRFEAYYLGYARQGREYAAGTADEQRHSLGVRRHGQGKAWDWNLEAVLQAGDFGHRRIRAWTLASDSGRRWPGVAGHPRLGLKADIASGDRDPSDGRLETFNAMYPTPTYFSEASLVAPANFVDLQPSLGLSPAERISLLLGWNFLWKQRREDAVYTTPAPLSPLPGSAGGARRIGDQLRLEASWKPQPGLELRAAYVHFNAGAAVRQAGGRDVDFAMLSASLRY